MTAPTLCPGIPPEMGFSPKSLGASLRLVREESNMMAKEVAEAAGIAPSQLSEAENGKRNVTPNLLARLSPVFGMELGQLQTRIEELAAVIEREPNRLREAEGIYSLNPNPLKKSTHPPSMGDHEALARYFTAKLSRKELFELVHKFTESAEAGDHHAALCARALLGILTS